MGLKYSFSVFIDVSGYQWIRAGGRYVSGAKERREGGSTTRQDAVMYVVTVKTALVKGPLCAQVRIAQE